MRPDLPEAFCSRMRKQLGEEFPAFLRSMENPPVRGIRMNPLKPCRIQDQFRGNDPVPWAENGYYLQADSTAGSTIWHEAGAFYIQDPSAMIPMAVLSPKGGETVLDLCSAPGGKATQAGVMMAQRGLLVCNEPVPKRAAVLSGNIERMGIRNALVVSAWPDALASRWPEGFDAVLADVPCSGEGMFRRDPETITEWSADKAAGCAERQREIMAAAQAMVRPGGRLVYSTCTYNPAENEENVRWFLQQWPNWHTEPFSLPGIDAPEGYYTCYPHRVRGEGQFIALLRKEGEGEASLQEDRTVPKAGRSEKQLPAEQIPCLPEATHLFGSTLIRTEFLPDVQGIRVLRAGLHLGEIRGKNLFPDHAAADYAFRSGAQRSEISPREGIRYLGGETVIGSEKGWTVVCCDGLALGWGKGSDGVIKNHYPKGLRQGRLSI